MEYIELVIKIPEGEYQHIKNVWRKRRGSVPWSYIAFGTPLPKGHGRLVDGDKLFSYIETGIHVGFLDDRYDCLEEVKAAPTIIPEDKEEVNEVTD
jgi:hypothetical protein